MICGADFRFGFNREGSIKNLEERFNVSIADYTLVNGVRISSSTIKEYITSGNINGANLFLGRNYSLIGKIKDVDIIDNSTKIEFDYYLHLLPPNGVYKTMIKYRNNIYEAVTQIINIDKGDKRIYITVSQPIYNILDNDIELIFLNN
jgi:riboflavin kinase/FMN adenylyltransferase